jgi:hypothetical protein
MTRKLMLAMASALLVAACEQREPAEGAMADSLAAPVATADAGVELAVAIHRGIEANPAAAESVLTANGLTAASLDSLMYEIASDSARSAAYTKAIE